jgi:hypothetical protein
MKPIEQMGQKAKRKNACFLRHAVLAMASVVALSGSCLAAEDIYVEGKEPVALQAGERLDDAALGAVRGMGATMALPIDLAVILWDEKGTCCNRPGPTPAGHAGQGADTRTVAFRLVIQQ